jgi:DNA polymerase III epsilon subunit-like protein
MLVVDVESTGLDPQRHALVSVGAIDFLHPDDHFYRECRVWEGAAIDREALRINGFSDAQLRDSRKPSLAQTLDAFIQWFSRHPNRTFAGLNPAFDRALLIASAQRAGIEWRPGHRMVDLHSLCYAHQLGRGVIPSEPHDLMTLTTNEIFRYVGLPPEPRPHHALTGAKMEAEAFSRLISGTSLLKEFERYPVPFHIWAQACSIHSGTTQAKAGD